MPGLIIQTAGSPARNFELAEEAIIGREPANNVYIDDPRASRQHSRITKQPDGYYISDLNSRNGTLVNGEKIATRKLKDNDRIVIGRTTITYKEILDTTAPQKDGPAQNQKPVSANVPPSPKNDAATAGLSAGKAPVNRPEPFSPPVVKPLNDSGLPSEGLKDIKGVSADSPQNSPKGNDGPDISKSREAVSEMAKMAEKVYGKGGKPAPAPKAARIYPVQEPAQTGSFASKLLLFIGLLIFFLILLFGSKWAGEKLILSIAERHPKKDTTQTPEPPVDNETKEENQ
ncbi:MAG: FHA domain-containing protein [Planctomycetota bacterium]